MAQDCKVKSQEFDNFDWGKPIDLAHTQLKMRVGYSEWKKRIILDFLDHIGFVVGSLHYTRRYLDPR